MRWARIGGVAMMVMLLAVPAFSGSRPHGGECKRLTRQIARYQNDARMASARGNDLWEDASKDRVQHLSTRRAARCPEYRKKNPFVAFADWVGDAAKAAAPYLIPGM